MTPEECKVLQQTFDDEVRRKCRFIGRKVELLERVTRVTGPTADPIDNVIVWSDLDGETVKEEIESHIEYFTALGHAFEWIAYDHDQPGDLVDRLLARGFLPGSKERVVIAPSKEVIGPELPVGLELRTITDPDGVADVVAVGDEIWGAQHHDFLTRWLTDLVRDHGGSTIILAAYEGEKPVAASWALLWDDRPFALLFGGSVLPNWRGRGIYRAMVGARAQAATRKGLDWCLVDAGPESFPILDRIGFETMTERSHLRWPSNPRGSA